MANEKKKSLIQRHKMSALIVISTIVMFFALSYAWLQITLLGEKELTLHAGSMSLVLDDSMEGGINIESSVPVLDEVGMSQEGYTFTLENNGKIASDYTIYLDDLPLMDETRMNDAFIKYQLVRDDNEKIDLLSSIGENPNRILDNGTIFSGEKYTYTLKMWIDSSATNEVAATVFKGQLRIEAMQSANKLSASATLLKKANKIGANYETVSSDEKKEMFTFTHEAGKQQSGWSAGELKDYRYIGTNPNNYVIFNGETWRIIGVFTIEDENGKREKRMKIIRDQSLGNYSWDNQGNYGVNDWSNSALQKMLNSGVYYNRKSGSCPRGYNGGTTSCDFTSNGLTVDAKSMIGKAKWYLGGYNLFSKSSDFYGAERGDVVYSGRPIRWVGEVGLMYPSDYGYAASGSSCLNTNLSGYNLSCKSTNWLYRSIYQWTFASSFESFYFVYYVSSSGDVSRYNACNDFLGVRPSVYLKSNVLISEGDGSSSNPYTLTID